MSAPAASVPESEDPQNNTLLFLESNPIPSGRRRRVTKAEKKSTVELGPTKKRATSNSSANGKDLENMIKEKQPVPRRRRDSSSLKKALTVSRVLPRNNTEFKQPWWRTFRTMVINALLLAVLVSLVRAILGLDGSRLASNMDAQYAALHLENRIAEVETSLKKTATATQLQLDSIVNRAKRVEEKGSLLREETEALAAKIDDMGKYLVSLKDSTLLTNDDFEILSKELKDRASSEDGRSPGFSMDDVRNYAREVIVKEIEKHAADGIGKVDYALASGGAKVVRHSEPYVPWKSAAWFSVGSGRTAPREHAQKMLQPSHGEPGECFALKGSRGFVEIKLKKGIIPDAVTLEHVAESVAYDRSSAPQECLVSGWFEDPEDVSSSGREKMLVLKEFSYDFGKGSVQTFDIETTAPGFMNMIRLDLLSNHGSPSHTCIYRFRVHGYDPGNLPQFD